MELRTEILQLFHFAPQFGVLNTFRAARSLLKSLGIVLKTTSFSLFKLLINYFSLSETDIVRSP
jgi:hypothetical protein